MSNIELQNIASKLGLPLVGVFSKDQLPSKKIIGSYIINMQNSADGNGTHWIYARIFPCGKAIYSDSFGVAMPLEVKDFLKPFEPVAYNTRQLQDLKSENCGRYCILIDYYFTYECKNDKMKYHRTLEKRKCLCPVDENFFKYLSTWTDNTEENEKLLMKRWKQIV